MKNALHLSVLALFCSCNPKELADTLANANTAAWENYHICYNYSGKSYSNTVTFKPANMTMTEVTDYYNIPNCIPSSASMRDVIDYTYSYNSATKELTTTILRGQVAYLNQTEVDHQNNTMECGYQNWRLNVLHDVSDVMCSGGTIMTTSGPSVDTNVTKTASQLIWKTLQYTRI